MNILFVSSKRYSKQKTITKININNNKIISLKLDLDSLNGKLIVWYIKNALKWQFGNQKVYVVIEDRIDECLYRVGNVADINSCETVEFDDDYDDDDYSVEEDDSEYEEEEDEAKDILDLIERCVKYGTNCMDVVGCTKIACGDCPFSYDSKLNEKHVGCTCLSQKEINDIARRFLNGEER